MREYGHQPRHPAATSRVGGGGGCGFCHSTAEERVTLMPAELARPAPPPWRGRGRSRLGHADRCGPRSPPCDRRGPCTARHSTVHGRRCWMERRAGRAWRGGGADSHGGSHARVPVLLRPAGARYTGLCRADARPHPQVRARARARAQAHTRAESSGLPGPEPGANLSLPPSGSESPARSRPRPVPTPAPEWWQNP